MDRDEFMELVYETFAEEPDNVLANGIIEAADAYVEHEKTQLSKESTTSDLISRQVAIDAVDAIGHIATMPDGDKCIRRSAVKYTLSMLPPAQPEPQWIPVSERLPETEEFVLASLSGKYRNTTFEHACEIADYADGEWCVYAYPHMSAEKCAELIEAWMPLPEPYKPNNE